MGWSGGDWVGNEPFPEPVQGRTPRAVQPPVGSVRKLRIWSQQPFAYHLKIKRRLIKE